MVTYLLSRWLLKSLFLLGLCAHSVYGINFFEGTYSEALAKSRAENKNLLLYFTATWCGPCHYMEKNVFTNDTTIRITDQQVVALKLDYDAWRNKPLVEKYKVGGLPTFILLNTQEIIERRFSGRMSTARFIRFLMPEKYSDQTVSEKFGGVNNFEFWYEQKRRENAAWKTEIGVQAGPTFMTIPGRSGPGFDAGFFVAFSRKRVSLRPGLLWAAKESNLPDGHIASLRYIELPVTISYLLRRQAVFNLPGGFRTNLTPYVSTLINRQALPIRSFDYGTKLGISSFIGDTSQLEAQLGYSLGLANVMPDSSQRVYNRGVYFAVLFIL